MSNLPKADIAYITDLHLSIKKNPKWFGGTNYLSDQLKRLEEVVMLANERETNLLLLGGDIFDQYDDCNVALIRELERIFNLYQGKVCSVIGNHDLLGKSMEGYSKSYISLLSDLKIVSFDHQVFYPNSGYSIYNSCVSALLQLYHWDSEACKLLLAQKFVEGYTEKYDYLIGVMHVPVGPIHTDYCLGVDQIQVKGFNIMFFGDQHEGWEPKDSNGCILANPGSFSWNSIKDIERIPRAGFYNLREKKYWEEELSCPPLKEFSHKVTKKFVLKTASFQPTKNINELELINEVGQREKYSTEEIECLVSELRKD